MSLRVLTSADVNHITSKLDPDLLQSIMEDVFALISSDSLPKHNTPHRISIPMENHTGLFMPARISTTARGALPDCTAIKVVSVPSSSDDTRGLPASTLVLDNVTGVVKAIVNARSLTALRNAAGSLLSTTLVGLTSPRHIVAFGAGQQINAHLDIFFAAFSSVKSCTVVNRTLNGRVMNLISHLRAKHPSVQIDVQTPDGSDEAQEALRATVSEASIIITATASRSPLFPSAWVRCGTHIILIGSYTPQMKEIDTELIMRAIPSSSNRTGTCSPILLVDSVAACFTEAGELLEAKLLQDQVVEIGKLVLEKRGNVESDWRESPPHRGANNTMPSFDGPVTIFKSVGVGLQDVAIAGTVVAKAEELERLNEDGAGIVVQDYD
ncbi:hypothetical protein GYMLUDRAFT_148213 [Collybiopsis luxurians FD-317 M1]|nr:hypothetical protein GYMLUDRAFT_148213 [Collybiopsis luxurians FD-317 M1]